jgi:hypothetical protein
LNAQSLPPNQKMNDKQNLSKDLLNLPEDEEE